MNPPKTTDSTAIIADKLDSLYVTTRFKYIMQTPAGYVHLDSKQNAKHWPLTPKTVAAHLAGKNAYGVFDANGVTKFMTFDVDFNEPAAAKWHTYRLIDVLCEDFGISREDIHVSLSGSKGYHVDLFFGVTIPTATAQAFHAEVMVKLGATSQNAISGGLIEFRPTWTQGVKIPLGIHQKTGNRCYFCNVYTLEPLETLEYVLGIEPMDAETLESIIELTPEQAQEFAEVVRKTDANVTVLDATQARLKAAAIIEAGQLTQSNTRHDTTFTLAVFFHAQGFEQEDATAAIMEILLNTPRDFFSKGSTPDFWQKETERLVKIVFDKGIPLGNADKPVRVYKSEILAVLNVGTFRQKQMAYAMLITSKRYGKTFFLTRGTAKKMLGIKSNETVQTAIEKLVECGFIEYVRKGEIDHAASRLAGQRRHKPNKYRILVAAPEKGEPFIDTLGEDLVKDANEVCTIAELRETLPRRQFDSHFRH